MKCRRAVLAVAIAAASLGALAQPVSTPSGPWPAKPVRIMVGASAGGGTDIIARMLGDKLGAVFGQPFVVENRPGAANTIASDVTAKSPPDGYTLLVGTNTAQAIAPHIMKLGFNPVTDLTPIRLPGVVPNVRHARCPHHSFASRSATKRHASGPSGPMARRFLPAVKASG